MKKVFNYIGLTLMVLVAASLIFANIGKIVMSERVKAHSLTLEEMIDSINTHLPVRGSGSLAFFVMNSVHLEDNNVVWEATLDTTFFHPVRESFLPESVNGGILANGNRSMALDLDTLLTAKNMMQSQRCNLLYYYLFARSKKPNSFYDEIIRRQYSQIWRIHSPFSNRQNEFVFTYQDQKEMESYCRNQKDAALEDFVSEYIKRQNLLLGIGSKNSDISMSMMDEGDNLVLLCAFGKSYSENGNKPISNLRSLKENAHSMLLEDVKTLPIFYDLDEISKRTGKGFLVRYTDFKRTDSIEFSIISSGRDLALERIKNEARTFNSNNTQQLSKSNPMPCVHQVVDESSKLYVFEYLWNEEIANINDLNHEAGMGEVLQEMISNPQSLEFMKLLIKENYGVLFRVEGSKTHKIIENKVSAQDIGALVKLKTKNI